MPLVDTLDQHLDWYKIDIPVDTPSTPNQHFSNKYRQELLQLVNSPPAVLIEVIDQQSSTDAFSRYDLGLFSFLFQNVPQELVFALSTYVILPGQAPRPSWSIHFEMNSSSDHVTQILMCIPRKYIK